MWIHRDIEPFLQICKEGSLPVKVLRGPRQVGKTSLLNRLDTHRLVLFDDLGIRNLAQENPRLFFEQFRGPLILDEATLAPPIFSEIKRLVDEERRQKQKVAKTPSIDLWITGSNQTLLQGAVQESLAGRASYFQLNTLSLHELKQAFSLNPPSLSDVFMKGGWPELYISPQLRVAQYLNDFIATFIEKDIVASAGIEKRSAFNRMLQLLAARTAQLLNASDIAKNVGVDTTTIQSWASLLEQNEVIEIVQPYYTNLNQRLIKTPKVFFEDIGLAVRLQGWMEFGPLAPSPYFGHLLENLAFTEMNRFFTNQGMQPEIYFVRSKDQVEVDFLIALPNQKYVAVEVKATPVDFTLAQRHLLQSLQLNILEKWVVSYTGSTHFSHARLVTHDQIFENLARLLAK